jgi:hypothetical protein
MYFLLIKSHADRFDVLYLICLSQIFIVINSK